MCVCVRAWFVQTSLTHPTQIAPPAGLVRVAGTEPRALLWAVGSMVQVAREMALGAAEPCGQRPEDIQPHRGCCPLGTRLPCSAGMVWLSGALGPFWDPAGKTPALAPYQYPREGSQPCRSPEQRTPASSLCRQAPLSPGRAQQSCRDGSVPRHSTCSSQMGPVPSPNAASSRADTAGPQPSCLHATSASCMSQESSHTVPQEPQCQTSTLPEHPFSPPTARIFSLSGEGRDLPWHQDSRQSPAR